MCSQSTPTPIELLVLDVDGVLTDGRLTMSADTEPAKAFFVQDGFAIKLWRRRGGRVALLSGRSETSIRRRAAELDIDLIQTGADDKLAAYATILEATACGDGAVAYLGDDIPDLGPMGRCAFPAAVANAQPAVKRAAAYVTRRRGGDGAVAELIELLLRSNGRGSRDLPGKV